MSLIKTIQEYQKYVKLNATTDFEKAIQPFEHDAVLNYIIPNLSKKLWDRLHTYYNASSPSPDAALDALLPYVQAPLARFAVFVASPFLDINLGSQGYTTASTSQFVPASEARVRKHDSALEALAWQSIEAMLVFLEQNKANYPEWVESPAYTMSVQGLINTAIEFDAIVPINQSRLSFRKLRPDIHRIEMLKIIPSISFELYAKLIEEIRANNVSQKNTTLLNLLRVAIANFVMSKTDDGRATDAIAFLTEAKKLIDSDPDSYPEYRDSSVFRGSAASYELYENSEDDKIFIFGAQ